MPYIQWQNTEDIGRMVISYFLGSTKSASNVKKSSMLKTVPILR